jgi:hypothetical protein
MLHQLALVGQSTVRVTDVERILTKYISSKEVSKAVQYVPRIRQFVDRKANHPPRTDEHS